MTKYKWIGKIYGQRFLDQMGLAQYANLLGKKYVGSRACCHAVKLFTTGTSLTIHQSFYTSSEPKTKSTHILSPLSIESICAVQGSFCLSLSLKAFHRQIYTISNGSFKLNGKSWIKEICVSDTSIHNGNIQHKSTSWMSESITRKSTIIPISQRIYLSKTYFYTYCTWKCTLGLNGRFIFYHIL